MATTHSPGTCTAFRMPKPKQFRQVANGPVLPGYLGGPCEISEIDITPEEYRELRFFDDFLTNHVQPNRIYNVQCMMLWNEWVRTFIQQTREFPQLILEKECRTFITGKFGVEVASDSVRGAVYPGLRFIA